MYTMKKKQFFSFAGLIFILFSGYVFAGGGHRGTLTEVRPFGWFYTKAQKQAEPGMLQLEQEAQEQLSLWSRLRTYFSKGVTDESDGPKSQPEKDAIHEKKIAEEIFRLAQARGELTPINMKRCLSLIYYRTKAELVDPVVLKLLNHKVEQSVRKARGSEQSAPLEGLIDTAPPFSRDDLMFIRGLSFDDIKNMQSQEREKTLSSLIKLTNTDEKRLIIVSLFRLFEYFKMCKPEIMLLWQCTERSTEPSLHRQTLEKSASTCPGVFDKLSLFCRKVVESRGEQEGIIRTRRSFKKADTGPGLSPLLRSVSEKDLSVAVNAGFDLIESVNVAGCDMERQQELAQKETNVNPVILGPYGECGLIEGVNSETEQQKEGVDLSTQEKKKEFKRAGGRLDQLMSELKHFQQDETDADGAPLQKEIKVETTECVAKAFHPQQARDICPRVDATEKTPESCVFSLLMRLVYENVRWRQITERLKLAIPVDLLYTDS